MRRVGLTLGRYCSAFLPPSRRSAAIRAPAIRTEESKEVPELGTSSCERRDTPMGAPVM